MHRNIMFALACFLSLVYLSCAPKVISVEKPAEVFVPVTKTGWESEWEQAIKKAQEEGKVVIHTARGPAIRESISQSFKTKYGITIEWVVGRPAELTAKLFAERRAGIFWADLTITGANPPIPTFKPAGILAPLAPILILPEVKDPKAWWENRLPFVDRDGYVLGMTMYPQSPFHLNTDLVRKEELASYKDLLNPKWKGKILVEDPTVPGPGNKWFIAMTEPSLGPILGLDYMRNLVRQEPLVMRDQRLAAEWLLRGKYLIGLNIPPDTLLQEWHDQGIKVPLEAYTPREGGYVTGGAQYLALFNKAPHPNATRVFTNWILTREGQIILSGSTMKHSTRIDIPPPLEINPDMKAREPGVKYVTPDTEEILLKQEEYIKQALEIFGPLLK